MPTENTNKGAQAKKAAPVDDAYGHLQPQAIGIEQAVIGSLLIDSYAYSAVSELLHPETFYDPRHQYIYAAIQSLNMSGRPVDILTVPEELKRQGHFADVGGDEYILELSARTASSANIEDHAKTLADKYVARQLISLASKVQTGAFSETVKIEDLMQETEGALFELSQKSMKREYQPIGPVMNEAIRILKKSAENTSGMTGHPSGFSKLDKLTSGWQKSDLVIIAGRPAMGKTSFALSIAKNMAVDYQIPVAFFSLEMSSVQLANRLMSNTFEIEGSKMLNGQLDPDEWLRIDKNMDRLGKAPLYIDDTASLSVFELRSKARRLKSEKDIQVIIIDYLQLMTASGMKFGNRQEEVSTISKSLKGLAKDLEIPIIALSQLNRGVESREGNEGKRPQLSDLRESGAIEQDADMVLFVHRPEYYRIYEDDKGNDLHGKAEIIVAKHRKGATDIITLRFKGEYTRFENLEHSGKKSKNLIEGGEIIGSKLDTLAPPDPRAPLDDPLSGGVITDDDLPY